MYRYLNLIIVLMIVVGAKAQEWTYEEDIASGSAPHGVVVDPSGRIWVGYYGYTDTLGLPNDTIPITPIYVFNSDGSQASFSPIEFLIVDGVTDTMLNFCRGMTLDHNGNILYSVWDDLYRINYQTGEGMNKVTPMDGKTLTEAAVDDQGYIYIGHVVPNGEPGYIYDANFNYYGNFADNTYQIGRSLVITPDATDIYWGEIYGSHNGILHYHSDNGVNGPWTLVETLYGETVDSGEPRLWAECLDWDNNGLLWVGTFSDIEPYSYKGWYALDPTQNFAMVDSVGKMGTFSSGEIAALDSIIAPRGATWSADGLTMYTADFNGLVIKKWNNPDPVLPRGYIPTAVTFHVNTSNIDLSPGDQIGLRGSVPPLDWGSSFLLTDLDVDGVFEGTAMFDGAYSGPPLEYKFVVDRNDGSTWWEDQNGPDYNRTLSLNQDVIDLPVVNFNYLEAIADVIIDATGDNIPDRLGEIVTVSGIILTPNLGNPWGHVISYIQDGSNAAVQIFSRNSNQQFNVGDAVKVTGELLHYYGSTEIEIDANIPGDFTVKSSGNPLPAPIPVTFAELNDPAFCEAYESQLISIDAVTNESGIWPQFDQAAIMDFSDSFNNWGQVSIVRGSNITLSLLPIGRLPELETAELFHHINERLD